jgi:transcriptional regulator with XRE-family HTH domain
MKQPELGRKIVELRKAKGMTQEDLVDKCNISVRTIQRIETGDVMPRSYTVKTILSALEYDFDDVFDPAAQEPPPAAAAWWQTILLTDRGGEDQGALMRALNIACLAGVAYFVLGFLESAAEYFRYRDEFIFGTGGYVVLKIAVLVSFIFFQRGLIAVAGVFDNYLLKIICILLVGSNILVTGYDIASVFYHSQEREFMLYGVSMCFGAMGIIYGVALRRLEKNVGRVAELAGIFEIIAGIFFLTVALFFVGFIALIPAELFEIILIFRVIESIRTGVHPSVKNETAPG